MAPPPEAPEAVYRATPVERMRGWLTHLVTATGAAFGLLALIAITEHDWLLAFIWMGAALFVDGVDGSLARWSHVKRVLPNFDGALLDNLVDYLNYVIVPAFFLYEAGLLPGGWEVAGPVAITLASAYQFCQLDAKTSDNYFKGFPSYWNGVAFYLFFLGLGPWVNLGFVALFCVLVFVPFLYVYPSRTRAFRRLTLALTALWGALCVAILAQYPDPSPALLWISLLYLPYYIAVSVYSRKRSATMEPAR